MKPPSFGPGDEVRARGRYGTQTVVGVVPNVMRPQEGMTDGHGYVVTGGKGGRQSMHASGDLFRPPTSAQLNARKKEWG